MHPEDIDGSALAIARIRDFDQHLPAGAFESVGDPGDNGGVILVEQPIEGGAAPRCEQAQADIEGAEDASQQAECDRFEVPAFHQ